MTQENVEIVRAIYAAYAQGDVEAAVGHFGAEIEWSEPPRSPRGVRPYRGVEGARQSLGAWVSAWDEYRLELDELIDAGDDVLARSRQTVRGKGSGIEVEQPLFSVWTLRDGKVVRHRMYHDEREALEAAGLPE